MNPFLHRFTPFIVLLLIAISSFAQTTDPTVGLRENPTQVHAFINAAIVTAPGELIEKGTMVIRDGIIEGIGEKLAQPEDARVWDCEGLTLYPGLIETYTSLGVKDESGKAASASYWNERVHPEADVLAIFDAASSDLDPLREMGFTAAHIVPENGVIRGQSAVITLSDGEVKLRALRERVAQVISLDDRQRGYPTSLMGRVALVRQAMLDTKWYTDAWKAYKKNPAQAAPERNVSLEALQSVLNGEQPVLFTTRDEKGFLRAQKTAAEFDLNTWCTGNGFEYRQIGWYDGLKSPLFVPVDFPQKPHVETYEETLDINTTALRHWERAPSNPAVLTQNELTYTLSTHDLNNVNDFGDRVRDAVKHGLSNDDLLASLTTVPAKILGIDKSVGTLEKGKRAHFVIVDGALFGKESKVMETWIDGNRYVINRKPEIDPCGTWSLHISSLFPQSATLEISGNAPKISAKIIRDASEFSAKWSEQDGSRLAFQFDGDDFGDEGILQFSARVNNERIDGYYVASNGSRRTWYATLIKGKEEKEKEEEDEENDAPEYVSRIAYPPSPFGMETLPEQVDPIFIDNATIWTCGPQGILEPADMIVSKGKIVQVGQDLSPPRGAFVIDGKGKHISPGLIDAHSHTAIESGINETGQVITSEVRIGDVIDSYDINIYRELAGGLTMAHVLHGSANPIGGQSGLIKLRWGMQPEKMEETRGFGTIKFALGENVRRVNWDSSPDHFPKSRMGVEQIIRDRFMAAKDYQTAWDTYNKARNKSSLVPPRRDLELDALVEIMNGERWIHCHSYRQDEILMLMRLAEDLGFRVGTFQHILEGYKVADVMAQHGAMGSSFSDWWAYKMEVVDSIPYNGALMHEQGVTVTFNSDSNELARRLNTEATKAVKYGGVSEEEALKFVTINAAKQVYVDEYTGSLEPGKDADFVVWNGSPLSMYTICLQTWIDGVRYFDLDEDEAINRAQMEERNALIQKLLTGDKKKKDNKESASEEEGNGWNEEDRAFWFGTIKATSQQGDCGCDELILPHEHSHTELQSIRRDAE